MTPKPQENIPAVHAGEDHDMPGSLNNVSSLGNLNHNLKLNGFINNGFVSDCPAQSDSKSDHQTKELELKEKNNAKNTSLNSSSGASTGVQEKPIVDFDDLLPHVGEFGRYQKILFLLMIPFAFFVAFVYFSQIFITIVPEEHWCWVPELEHLSVEERSTKKLLFSTQNT
ncbi:AAEL013145-PA [Aedes aegypti]|uniref:AAEL013145-PA n=1 Tax=Aedes aegypti TaxID=7159 RepID=Q16K13_AEDAE|nr:AAEL013145-PA [Aedes aegypti]